MSSNPYASPDFGGAPIPTPPHLAVRGPAIGLLVVQSLWMAILFGMSLIQLATLLPKVSEQYKENLPGAVGYVLGMCLAVLFPLAYEGTAVYGAYCMLRLEKLQFARIGAILSIIPICSGCYVLGIPFGIWALIVLNRPEVKAAFR